MSPGTSMLSTLNPDDNTFTANIFNPGNLGPYPDGIVYYENKIYVSAQGNWGAAGTLYKLSADGTVESSTEVGTNPYALAIANDKVYLTNGPAHTVSVVNVTDLSHVKDITVGVYPQEILAYNDKVFVANTSEYMGDTDSTVTVIDAATDDIITSITVKPTPSALAVSSDNHLLIGCPGGTDNGWIYKVELTNYTKVDSFYFYHGFGKDIFVDPNSDKVYFKSNNHVIIEYDLATRTEAQAVVDQDLVIPNGYAYDYINKVHYIVDAVDYISNGTMKTYDSNGSLLNTYETGIAPRRIYLHYGNASGTEEDILATDYRLNQNYPNPFNPTTNISFSLPEMARVKLTVFNMLGERVAELVNGSLTAGAHEVTFNASNLSSGMYYYSLETNGFYRS